MQISYSLKKLKPERLLSLINQDTYTEADFIADALFDQKDSLVVKEKQEAFFYYFKPSNKYYTDALGRIPLIHDTWTRETLLAMNGGKMPGLSSEGRSFRIVVIPVSESVIGWPQILEPVE